MRRGHLPWVVAGRVSRGGPDGEGGGQGERASVSGADDSGGLRGPVRRDVGLPAADPVAAVPVAVADLY
jgi:hypothetical protein